MKSLLIWIGIFLSLSAEAKTLCEEDLLRQYGTEYSEALIGGPTRERTLRPEKGSIGYLYPDILARVANLARMLEADELGVGIHTLVTSELRELGLDQRDPRLERLVDSIRPRLTSIEDPDAFDRDPSLFYLVRNTKIAEAHERLHRLGDHMWEFVVALMVAGDRIYLNKQISYVHSDIGYKGATFGGLNPEIDVIAVDKNGGERWIEVKNAKVRWWTRDYYLGELFRQARMIKRIRENWPEINIRRELIFVEPFPYNEYMRLMKKTKNDRINSIFLHRSISAYPTPSLD